jgi:hypothetical protein
MSNVFGQPLASGKVVVYIPSTRNVSQLLSEVEQEAEVNGVLSKFAKMFGGSTSTRATGAWITESGDLVKEEVTLVYSFVDVTETVEVSVKAIAAGLAKRLQQEAVLVEINGTAYTVAPF